MKIVCLMLILFVSCEGALSQARHYEAPRTVAEAFDRLVSGEERQMLHAAEAMPEDKYNFAPVEGEFKGVRTFAQMVNT